MRHSERARVNYACLTLPHSLKTDGTTGKLVMRRLARKWLPAADPIRG